MGTRTYKISKHMPSIFQGKLDFSARRDTFSLTAEHPAERTLLRIIFAGLIVLACAYLYFVTASVLNVIASREALAQVTDIEGKIGSLEQRYFALSQAISPQAGETIGLVPVGQTQYIYRPGNIGAATIARNEI